VQQTHGDDFVAEVLNASGSIYPQVMVHADVAVQPPGAPLRGAVMASYVGSRRASGNNALLHGGPYQLPPYVLLDATLSTTSFPILRGAPQEISFQLLGKNLLGASGPAPGFSGVDYPLSPRALLFQVTLGL
jgi:iron complex outermembrane receptor protein